MADGDIPGEEPVQFVGSPLAGAGCGARKRAGLRKAEL